MQYATGGLTFQQRKLFDYLKECIIDEGFCPSYDEMLKHMNLRSKNSIHTIIKGLKERGFIHVYPRCARSIVILKEVEIMDNADMLASLIDCIQHYATPDIKGKYARETMAQYMLFLKNRREGK